MTATIISTGRMTEGQYNALHAEIRTKLGKPQKCDSCGTTTKQNYEWANISGEYKRELTDWRRLCIPCHRRYDHGVGINQCLKGHTMTVDNTYTYPKGNKSCRTCRKERAKVNNTKRYWDKIQKRTVYVASN